MPAIRQAAGCQRRPMPTAIAPLAMILDSRKQLRDLMSLERDELNLEQRKRLHQLSTHFSHLEISRGDGQGDDPVAGAGAASNRRRKRRSDEDDSGGRDAKRRAGSAHEGEGEGEGDGEGHGEESSSPWKRFLRLTPSTLVLSQAIHAHLATFGDDARTFLLDVTGTDHDMAVSDPYAGSRAFSSRYSYTLDLQGRRQKDTIRWGFTMIMYFDLVKLIRPNGTGRVRHLMIKELEEFLGPVMQRENMNPTVVLAHINQWSVQGAKLNGLCSKFGPGCLFFLDGLLSPDFLRTKYTATGRWHDQAIQHLERIGLPDTVASSPVNQLGANIRRFLIQPFDAARASGPRNGGVTFSAAIGNDGGHSRGRAREMPYEQAVEPEQGFRDDGGAGDEEQEDEASEVPEDEGEEERSAYEDAGADEDAAEEGSNNNASQEGVRFWAVDTDVGANTDTEVDEGELETEGGEEAAYETVPSDEDRSVVLESSTAPAATPWGVMWSRLL
ncbi:hypothetical protein HRR83_000355 [Exophiala dermatitidis]|uniref:Uncharacterized protein n=1 Tax=Exophiala dermatitidis TaxID=5970 RepID=A0AAN6IY65_EXODE|nr:hypothetical protein HRR73_002891 [Exophiala dermatitidis]KAJ4524730.1 hypothetical protein HRR75_000320 [Exophiala dermatitidis]KAJ4527603.1 hypothetical protein HRR74_000357 [Exophiala dermatitidis]KAJ4531179.1 hypothetical protein HRR76_008853 [Exophiala dermatitidis]KAJ4536186.1 hypothetical protein HRR78_008625 [Exophiala dermatitidis]